MTRLDMDGPDCPHGFPSWRRTRAGEHVCPHCRRAARAAGVKPKTAQTSPRQGVLTLGVDHAARAANDRTLDDDEQPPVVAPVIPITRARRAR